MQIAPLTIKVLNKNNQVISLAANKVVTFNFYKNYVQFNYYTIYFKQYTTLVKYRKSTTRSNKYD